MLYTDTDSLIVSLRSHNLAQDMMKIGDSMDFSNFHDKHELYNKEREAKLGCMKIEMAAHKVRF